METTTTLKPEKKRRQGRINRDPALVERIYPLEEILRGEAILIALDQYRFLTNSQVAELLFRHTYTEKGLPRSEKQFQETCNESLSKLMDAGLIERLQVYLTHRITGKTYMGAVNILSPDGVKEVKRAYDRQDQGDAPRWTAAIRQFSFRKIDHELAVADVAIALNRSLDGFHGGEYWVYDWHDDDLLARAKTRTRFGDFTPDGWCVVVGPHERLCPLFWEIDRGTEIVLSKSGSTKDWKTKVERLGDYFQFRYRTAPFYADRGVEPAAMVHPIVLTVTTSQERLDNMLEATMRAGGQASYWYTTQDQLQVDLFDKAGRRVRHIFGAITEAPIWRRPGCDHLSRLADHLTGTPVRTGG